MRMRTTRILSVLLTVWILLLASVPAIAAPEDYDKNAPQTLQEDYLYGEAAVAIDADTGDVLFSKNSRVRMYPASTTKIMTLLLAVESGWSFDTPVTIPPEAGDIPSDSSIVPVYSGETTTFGELLYGMMLHSGNDAANAVAVLVSGSVPAFVQRMNDRAQELGCVGTHFVNPHGYHDENHYSTALDLALITREALKHESIREIVSTRSYTINVSPRGEIPLNNTNVLLNENNAYYYEDCIGVKTGTHSKAGQCFVGAAEKDGVTLITVTLKAGVSSSEEGNYKWVDTIRLFNYGFTCYTPYTMEQMFELVRSMLPTTRLSNASEDDPMGGVLQFKITNVSNPDYERMIQTGNEGAMQTALADFSERVEIDLVDDLTAPVSAGENVGTFRYTAQDGEVITASLIAGRDIAAQPERVTIDDVFPFIRIFDNLLVRMLVFVLLLLVIALALYSRAKRKRKERRRRELYERRKREYLQRQNGAGRTHRTPPSRTPSTRRPQNARSASRSGQRPSTRRPEPSRQRRSSDDDIFGDF